MLVGAGIGNRFDIANKFVRAYINPGCIDPKFPIEISFSGCRNNSGVTGIYTRRTGL